MTVSMSLDISPLRSHFLMRRYCSRSNIESSRPIRAAAESESSASIDCADMKTSSSPSGGKVAVSSCGTCSRSCTVNVIGGSSSFPCAALRLADVARWNDMGADIGSPLSAPVGALQAIVVVPCYGTAAAHISPFILSTIRIAFSMVCFGR